MKVIIDGIIHDSEQKPIIVVLNDNDKKNISNMHPEAFRYMGYPASMPVAEAESLIKKYGNVRS